jgi:putative transcriptional regulator
VSSKPRKLTPAELAKEEAGRDIGAEILQSLKDMKAGKGQVVLSSATEAREATGLSQSQFARLLGVSVRTLQGWEQGRKQPSGAARTLLAIAKSNPKAILAVSAD